MRQRWDLPGGELRAGLAITHDDHVASSDPSRCMSEDEVLDALVSPMGFAFHTSERDRLIEIARAANQLGPIAHLDHEEASQLIRTALRQGTLIARRSKPRPAAESDTLIVYGEPAKVNEDVIRPGQSGNFPRFQGKLTRQNRSSFEAGLVRELTKMVRADKTLLGHDLTGAKAYELRSLDQLRALLSKRTYSLVILYGHLISYKKGGPQSFAMAGGEWTDAEPLAKVLKEGGVSETLIAGCSSAYFAAGINSEEKSIRAGGLLLDRMDDIVGDEKSVTLFRIETQPIKWWPE